MAQVPCRCVFQARAFRRQADMSVAALEQAHAQFVLQLCDLVAHRALGHVQGIPCRREAHSLGNGAKYVEAVKGSKSHDSV